MISNSPPLLTDTEVEVILSKVDELDQLGI
jgi:hypothetical protein